MKRSTLKTFIDVHSWTGLGAGMALFVAFYAGAITVFTHEVGSWDSYSVSVAQQQDLEQAQILLDLVIATQPVAGETLRLNLSSAQHPGNEVLWYERLQDGSFERREFRLNEQGVLNTSRDTSELAKFIYALHYKLGIPGTWGMYLLGIICFIYGIALVSGVVIFLPNFVTDLFIVRPGKNKKRFWQDTHNIVGVLSLPWHIMFAWSSAILAIGFFILAPFQVAVFDKDIAEILGPQMGQVQTPQASGKNGPMLGVTELLAIVQTQTPNLEATQLRVINVGDTNAVVRVIGDTNSEHIDAYATLTLMASDGKIVSVSHPATDSGGAIFYRGLIALHFVSYGDYLAKWVNFILGLAGAFLFYSGNLLWIESRRKRRQAVQPRNTVLLARLNSGVCIGCMAGISAAFLASRGFAHLSDRAHLMEAAYFTVFVSAIIWCLVRPVASGTRDLLNVCALFSVAIPIFDVLLLDTTPWASASAGQWELFLVDAVSLIAAFTFWGMARAVQRRALYGDPNSVWAAPVAIS